MSGKININNYKCFLLFALLIAAFNNLSAQSKFSATAGWGYYELVNIGAQWNMTQISSLSLYAGANMGSKEKQQWSAGLSFDQTFRKPIVWKHKTRMVRGYTLLDQQ